MFQFIEKILGINLDLFSVFIVWSLMFVRTIVMVSMTPFLGGKGTPGQVRIVVSFVISLFAYMVIFGDTEPVLPQEKIVLVGYFFKEIFFGMALGMTTIMCFYAIEAGGRIVDSQRGSANAQIFVPALGQVTLYGLFQYWLGLALFLASSGHVIFLKAYLESFEIVNVLSFPNLAPGVSPFMELMVKMSADVLFLGMQLAAPVLIAVFLTDIVLGVANKMAPQIPVFELGFLLKGYVGSVMVAISILALVTQMDKIFNFMQIHVTQVIEVFQG